MTLYEELEGRRHGAREGDRASRKRASLRAGLSAEAAITAVGAHDALSAQLVEAYGFDVVWVSGFGVSTMAYALPDINLITMTEALDAAVRIDAATSLPVLADCDNGFGGRTNLCRTVRAYERAGIAGICVEDNTFPKTNSLYRDEVRRELVPLEEQAHRVRLAKEAQDGDDFVFVARVESLIAGWGPDDACARASAYAEAGADAVLVHSRDRSLADIREFLTRWDGRAPLVAVPTLFPDSTIEELHELGFQLVILANQPMRAAVQAMEHTLGTLAEKRTAVSVDADIATVDHIFRLVRLREAVEVDERPI